ncbi:hypothetical protein BJ166DRAFT_535696 [Pestalotiopsis sp. NC0098]|nr:hypothetical protein BJ166DRAFT_535696 [Pestalotiopsis sp. NC0098]
MVVLTVVSLLWVTVMVEAASVMVDFLVAVSASVTVDPGRVVVNDDVRVTNTVLPTVVTLAARVAVFPVSLVLRTVTVEVEPGNVTVADLSAKAVVVSMAVSGFSVLVLPVVFVVSTMMVEVTPGALAVLVVALVKNEITVTVVTGAPADVALGKTGAASVVPKAIPRLAFWAAGMQVSVVVALTVLVEVVVVKIVDVVALSVVVFVPPVPIVTVVVLVTLAAPGVTVEVTVTTCPSLKVVVDALGVEVAKLVTVVLDLTVVGLPVTVTIWL